MHAMCSECKTNSFSEAASFAYTELQKIRETQTGFWKITSIVELS